MNFQDHEERRTICLGQLHASAHAGRPSSLQSDAVGPAWLRFPLGQPGDRSGAGWGLGGRVQCHGGANERLQRVFINLVALMEIDGTPGVACEAGVEEA